MSNLAACPHCGARRQVHSGRPSNPLCRGCRAKSKAAKTTTRRQPTLPEWRQLATDAEVRAGWAAWSRGVRNPLTVAMADEWRKRVGT